MKTVSKKSAAEWIKPIRGKVESLPVSLFSIMRNEMYFLPAFFDHYRSLGIEQFLILDDCSDDGSLEYLAEQPDCVILQSPLRFGEVIFFDPGWLRKPIRVRAGIWMKQLIPELFFRDSWHVYVDADEFMVLPAMVSDLKGLTAVLDKFREVAVAGAMLEFYPATVDQMVDGQRPASFDDLIEQSPYFDKGPLVDVTTKGVIYKHKASTSGRLFVRHGLNTLPTQEELRAQGTTIVHEGKINWFAGAAVHKVPLLKASSRVKRRGSHNVSAKLCPDLTIPLCHFKFTGDAFRRMQEAVASGAWNKGSGKYQRYVKLIQAMQCSGESFLDKESIRFKRAADLEDVGHIRLGERFQELLVVPAGQSRRRD